MKISTEATLIGSLLGQKVKIPHNEFLENELAKHVLPVVNLYPVAKDINDNVQKITKKIWPEKNAIDKDKQFFPLTLIRRDGDSFLFPFEPKITITAKNNIIKRNVAKSKGIGSVKERWSRDDYTIDITCFLMDEDINAYPEKDFQTLYKFLKTGDVIRVYYEPFQLLEIDYMVIEGFTVPFTKGENIQAFTINAVSDHGFDLLIQTDKVFGSV